MKIIGIEGLSAAEIQSEIARGGKFVTFHYCISIVILSFKQVSDVHFIREGESTFKKSIGYTIAALLLGWWGIPFGIFWTLEALFYNLGGGKNVTKDILPILNISMQSPASAPAIAPGRPALEQAKQPPQKTCPKCAEKILVEALVCRYCGHKFDETEVAAAKMEIEAQIEREKSDAVLREQQKATLLHLRGLHANVAKAKANGNAWLVPLLFGGIAGVIACGMVSVALVYIVRAVNGNTEPSAIPGCSGMVVLIAAWAGGTYFFRRNAKRQSEIAVAQEEEVLKNAVDEISRSNPDWLYEIGGTTPLLDPKKVEMLLANPGAKP